MSTVRETEALLNLVDFQFEFSQEDEEIRNLEKQMKIIQDRREEREKSLLVQELQKETEEATLSIEKRPQFSEAQKTDGPSSLTFEFSEKTKGRELEKTNGQELEFSTKKTKGLESKKTKGHEPEFSTKKTKGHEPEFSTKKPKGREFSTKKTKGHTNELELKKIKGLDNEEFSTTTNELEFSESKKTKVREDGPPLNEFEQKFKNAHETGEFSGEKTVERKRKTSDEFCEVKRRKTDMFSEVEGGTEDGEIEDKSDMLRDLCSVYLPELSEPEAVPFPNIPSENQVIISEAVAQILDIVRPIIREMREVDEKNPKKSTRSLHSFITREWQQHTENQQERLRNVITMQQQILNLMHNNHNYYCSKHNYIFQKLAFFETKINECLEGRRSARGRGWNGRPKFIN